MFADNLKVIMGTKGITQSELSRITGIGRSSISMYLSGKTEPSPKRMKEISNALGCRFEELSKPNMEKSEIRVQEGQIPRLKVDEVAKMMGMNHQSVRKGLQQGRFPWGYAIHTSENHWVYFINAKKFAEIEGIAV